MLTWRVATRAAVPVFRGLELPTIGATLALATAPVLLTTLSGGTTLDGAVVATVIVGAAAVAFAVADPAGETLAAVPVSLGERRSLRLAVVVAGLAAIWIAMGLVVQARDHGALAGLDVRAAEAATVSGMALALAGTGDRRGAPGAAAGGAVFGPLAVLFVSAFAYRYDFLPMIGSPRHHLSWWPVAIAAWTVAAWSSRDPARA